MAVQSCYTIHECYGLEMQSSYIIHECYGLEMNIIVILLIHDTEENKNMSYLQYLWIIIALFW